MLNSIFVFDECKCHQYQHVHMRYSRLRSWDWQQRKGHFWTHDTWQVGPSFHWPVTMCPACWGWPEVSLRLCSPLPNLEDSICFQRQQPFGFWSRNMLLKCQFLIQIVYFTQCGWFFTTGHVLNVSPLHIEVSGRSLSRQHLGVICAQPANESPLWISLVIQWLRVCLPMQGTPVQSLVREDPTYRGAAKPMCHNYRAWALEPGSRKFCKSRTPEPVLRSKRSRCRRSPRSAMKMHHSQIYIN